MTSLKTSIKTITYLSDIGCLEIQGASLLNMSQICGCLRMFVTSLLYSVTEFFLVMAKSLTLIKQIYSRWCSIKTLILRTLSRLDLVRVSWIFYTKLVARW
ncbi:hypothetical protein B6P86_27105 [Escherichia coli]|nr:hypothetical protein [Escherichia coli]EFO2671780.1 hypothetical protein [Escherichia coli]EFO2736231.1 hypothetical protein [Escherichia coli]